MGDWVNGNPNKLCDNDCGTSACAAGWLPVVFPKHWKWQHGTHPVLKNGSCWHGPWGDLAEFFGIDQYFDDGDYQNESFYLFGYAHKRTPKQEAKIPEDFVKSKGYIYAD